MARSRVFVWLKTLDLSTCIILKMVRYNIPLLVLLSAVSNVLGQRELPTIELDYSTYRAFSYNATASTYKFQNIRYADPPTGEFRWAHPRPPSVNKTLQDGSYGPICYQAPPQWARTTYINNITVSQFSKPQAEDCLFLDVVVPKSALPCTSKKATAKLPVMLWIPGGGFTSGSKEPYDSTGLMERGNNRYIFIGMNYRIGAFGWMAGPMMQNQGGIQNAGFHDQVFALKWIQKYIHLFGGDASKVTILGESAGGSSITHHLTANGGVGNPGLFQRAIIQSAGHFPKVNTTGMDKNFINFAKEAGCKGNNNELMACLRSAPSESLHKANTDIIARSGYGQFTFGPVVDGSYVSELPQILLRQGAFDKSVKIMVSHNSDEGLSFIPTNVTTDEDFDHLLRTTLATASESTINTVINNVYNKAESIGNQFRARSFGVEFAGFYCTVNWMANALQNQTYNYIFSFNPGTHGQDLPYTFWKGDTGKQQEGMIMTTKVNNATAAINIQSYIANFVTSGDPNGAGLPNFPLYGEKGLQLGIDSRGTHIRTMGRAQEKRCSWWQTNRDY